jgi:diaminohydroxyphosphoribosylaminopyrimidine deaminase/5-amino-6-(5-phosphoribosylamino)uracil reductase
MQAALSLARRGLGRVWPNPAVGCVLVDPKGDRVVGRGWTQPGGRPHAETEALARAGQAARGATAFISLEPCNHQGQTPPCSEALVSAGIKRVVIAVADPDPRVSGSGIARLKDAGISVTTGICDAAATDINAGFFKRINDGRPLITLKTATSLDARIATAKGESKWITGETALAFGHRLRAEQDAIVIGIGTALADDPQLTCRLPGMAGHSPLRIVLDSRLRLSPASFLAQSAADVPTWIVAAAGQTYEHADDDYVKCGASVIEAPADDLGRPDVAWLAQEFGRRGLTRVMIEAGSALSASWLRANLVDRLAWFRAPKLLGGDGIAVTDALGIDNLSDAPVFTRMNLVLAGNDAIETYRRMD